MRNLLALFLVLISISSFSQKKFAWVSGKLMDENENPLPGVSVVILGKASGMITNDSGYFRIRVNAGHAAALVFSHAGYIDVQKNFYLSEGEEEKISIRLEPGRKTNLG